MRFGPLDFKTRSKQGFGDDWPISYEDLAPYYEKVERFVGIAGEKAGYLNAPDGIYLPPLRPRCAEVLLRRRAAKIGVPVLPSRSAVLTAAHRGRPPCHYCGSCGIGCDVGARFCTLDAIVPELRARRNFKLQCNAAVREVLVDRQGRARGVSCVDSATRLRDRGPGRGASRQHRGVGPHPAQFKVAVPPERNRQLQRAVFRRAERTFLPAGVRLPEELRSDFWESFRQAEVRRFISKMCAGYQGKLGTLPEVYKRIVCPALVLWGERDRHFPPSHARRLHAAVASSELKIIPEAGHWMAWDRAADVADAIGEFTGRSFRSGPGSR